MPRPSMAPHPGSLQMVSAVGGAPFPHTLQAGAGPPHTKPGVWWTDSKSPVHRWTWLGTETNKSRKQQFLHSFDKGLQKALVAMGWPHGATAGTRREARCSFSAAWLTTCKVGTLTRR